jgi:hypothetical protein
MSADKSTKPRYVLHYVPLIVGGHEIGPDRPLIVNDLDWTWAYAIYRPVTGHPGYLVGSEGSAWSTRQRGASKPWKRLQPNPHYFGYWFYSLQNATPGPRGTIYTAHELVLNTFIGPRPKGLDACHGDGQPWNNDVRNLRWDTRSGNCLDAQRHGTATTGSRNGNARLNENIIEEMILLSRKPSSERPSFAEIARTHGLTPEDFRRIRKGEYWKCVHAKLDATT